MTLLESVAILLAGVGAGTINTVVGSGTLITFPTLLAFGVPPVTANVSNTIGLVPGTLTGAYGYRRELGGQRGLVLRLLSASVLGGIAGAVLLLTLPSAAFEAVVPVLIGVGVLLVIFQPRLANRVAARAGRSPEERRTRESRWVWPTILGTGVYGGYFGAAQGVLLMGVLGIGVPQEIQRNNAVKNVLSSAVNVMAAVVFLLVADVDWPIVGLIAAGATLGGLIGARVGRRLPPIVLRVVIVVVGVVAVTAFVAG